MTAMAEFLRDSEEQDVRFDWLRKGAELNDPVALYELGMLEADKRFEQFFQAATQGHGPSLCRLATDFSD